MTSSNAGHGTREFVPQVVVLSKAQIADLVAVDGLDRDTVLRVIDTLDFYGLLAKGRPSAGCQVCGGRDLGTTDGPGGERLPRVCGACTPTPSHTDRPA